MIVDIALPTNINARRYSLVIRLKNVSSVLKKQIGWCYVLIGVVTAHTTTNTAENPKGGIYCD